MNRTLKASAAALLATCLLLQTTACSFLGPKTQTVSVTSQPAGASVTLNGERVGQTPLQYDLARKGEASLLIEKPGYNAVTRRMSRTLSGYGIADVIGGCFLLVPFLGLISDGAYAYDPANVTVILGKEGE